MQARGGSGRGSPHGARRRLWDGSTGEGTVGAACFGGTICPGVRSVCRAWWVCEGGTGGGTLVHRTAPTSPPQFPRGETLQDVWSHHSRPLLLSPEPTAGPSSQSTFLAPSNEPGQVHCRPLSAPPRLAGCGGEQELGCEARSVVDTRDESRRDKSAARRDSPETPPLKKEKGAFR